MRMHGVVGVWILLGDAFGNFKTPILFFHYLAESAVIISVAGALVLAEIKPHPLLQEHFPIFSRVTGRGIAYILLALYFSGRQHDGFSSAVCHPKAHCSAKDVELVNRSHLFQNYVLSAFLAIQGACSLFVGFQYRTINSNMLSQPMNEMYPTAATSNQMNQMNTD
eukprot:GEMP01045166.1.p1 GENE.GEMP01045166.1~~GEMP01045166.1.p1  ORF type:complete len:166 (+),score=18.27 GEMP01045166.1:113-610(+)